MPVLVGRRELVEGGGDGDSVVVDEADGSCTEDCRNSVVVDVFISVVGFLVTDVGFSLFVVFIVVSCLLLVGRSPWVNGDVVGRRDVLDGSEMKVCFRY